MTISNLIKKLDKEVSKSKPKKTYKESVSDEMAAWFLSEQKSKSKNKKVITQEEIDRSVSNFIEKGGVIKKLNPMPNGDSLHEYVWGTEAEINENKIDSINMGSGILIKQMDI